MKMNSTKAGGAAKKAETRRAAERFVKALEEVSDPFDEADLWTATLQTLLKSYDALPMVGRAA